MKNNKNRSYLPKNGNILTNNNSNERQFNLFTYKINKGDPLWRVKAYILGILFADGTIIRETYSCAIGLKEEDKYMLTNFQKAIGGSISKIKRKELYLLQSYNKNAFYSLKSLGMLESHSKKGISSQVRVPSFVVNNKVEDKSLLRDFIRGYIDGDGWITGSSKRGDLSFKFLGSYEFLNNCLSYIIQELPGLKYFITPERKYYIFFMGKKYRLYSRNKIYLKQQGFKKLSGEMLSKTEIKLLDHPFLKICHISGNLNSTRFFNWLYENDDNFNNKKIKGFEMCLKRKFDKSIHLIGNSDIRKSRLAPDWKDILYEIVDKMDRKFYTTREIGDITNKKLKENLKSQGLINIYQNNKLKNLNQLRIRLKYLEFLDQLVIKYRVNNNQNFYCSSSKTPRDIPNHFSKYIELISSLGIIKSIKNAIIYMFLEREGSKSFKQIYFYIKNLNLFNSHDIYPQKIILNVAELVSFKILLKEFLSEDRSFKESIYTLNKKILLKYYKLPLHKIFESLQAVISN